jgi:hypothetical protein
LGERGAIKPFPSRNLAPEPQISKVTTDRSTAFSNQTNVTKAFSKSGFLGVFRKTRVATLSKSAFRHAFPNKRGHPVFSKLKSRDFRGACPQWRLCWGLISLFKHLEINTYLNNFQKVCQNSTLRAAEERNGNVTGFYIRPFRTGAFTIVRLCSFLQMFD